MPAGSAPRAAPGRFVSWWIVIGSLAGLALVGYGVYRTPATSRLSIAAAVIVLLVYVALGRAGVPRLCGRYPAAVKAALWAGLAAGAVFAAEICLEYVLLPKDNTAWGTVEFGVAFLIYASAGTGLAWARRSLREAAIGSMLAAVVGSVVWCVFILATFYLFYGTDRQKLVFQAEGDFDDFRRSGMTDFPRFIMEDFLGATFFHLVLGPAFASVLGLAGGVLGKGLARMRRAA
ncbi:MAG TPA: hypothetical protein VMI94_17805 [Bryobacteraceae bacterium]|nr:hypothetical protein [Bryobacteraceae bacterium]